MSDSLWAHGLYNSWNSPGQNIGVGSLFLLQEIFPTEGWNPRLTHCRQIHYQLSHKGSPRILEWVSSLLQQIFMTQESNQSLLHCRQILYQLSYQGSPHRALACIKFPKEKSLLLSYTENPQPSYFQHEPYQCITFPTSRGYTINVK